MQKKKKKKIEEKSQTNIEETRHECQRSMKKNEKYILSKRQANHCSYFQCHQNEKNHFDQYSRWFFPKIFNPKVNDIESRYKVSKVDQK
jgi:hypothetical protein